MSVYTYFARASTLSLSLAPSCDSCGHVDVQLLALNLAAKLAGLVDRVVREVLDDRIEQISQTRSDDQVDVVTDLAADPQASPIRHQDRWITVAPDVVRHTPNYLV